MLRRSIQCLRGRDLESTLLLWTGRKTAAGGDHSLYDSEAWHTRDVDGCLRSGSAVRLGLNCLRSTARRDLTDCPPTHTPGKKKSINTILAKKPLVTEWKWNLMGG